MSSESLNPAPEAAPARDTKADKPYTGVPRSFSAIENHLDLDAGLLPKTCIVTGELVGPFKNGGLGTSMTGLAELLAAFGADITVLYTGTFQAENFTKWKARYAKAGITLETLDRGSASPQVGPANNTGWTNAWPLYQRLKASNFDVVHFNDTVGEGVYCFIAKRMGLAFENTLLLLALHSPTQWILEANANEENWLGFTFFEAAERISISATDLLWGPSRYLLGWIKDRGYKLPAQTYNQQYVIPSSTLFEPGREKCAQLAEPARTNERRKPKELIFFGRLEERKGIRLFTAALARIGPELLKHGVKVVLMGKPSTVGGKDSDVFLRKRSDAWPFEWRTETGFDQSAAVEYLRNANCVLVMPSPVDNSPCTVYEALQFGFPFIAAATGGIPELVHPDDHAKHLFEYRVDALADRIMDVVTNGISAARPAVPVAENQARWLNAHISWQDMLPAPKDAPSPKRYGVVIDHSANGAALEKTVASLRLRFGKQLGDLAVYRRDLVDLGALANSRDMILLDEMTDLHPADVLRQFRDALCDGVFVIRSGVTVDEATARIFDHALGSDADGFIPMPRINGSAVMPTLGASAAQSMLEGHYDAGGALFDLPAVFEHIEEPDRALDKHRLYFGLIEEMQVAGAQIWPIAEPVLELDKTTPLVLQLPAMSRRNFTYANAAHHEINQMMSIGRTAYSQLFPARPPVLDAGPLSTTIKKVVVATNNSPVIRSYATKTISMIAGEHGLQRVKRTMMRLAGRG